MRRNLSTKRWRTERNMDHYADHAAIKGLRSRAAFKLEEINLRFGRFLRQVGTMQQPPIETRSSLLTLYKPARANM